MKYIIPLLLTCSFLLVWDKAFGETVTTGNLLPNSGDGVDWGSSSTDQINPANSSGYVSNGSTINGFDITCSTSQSNCGYKYSVGGDFEVTGTATVSVDDIALTNNSINQSMLDNGITLNSYIDVANCESTEGNCESKGGANDSHTTTVQLEDSSGNVLSTTTQTRTEVTGFQGNCNGYPGTTTTGITTGCGQYNDRIIYLGVGANRVDWSWSGTDSNYSNQSRQGPNLLGSSLTMTYNNTEFNPIDDTTQDVIEDINTDIVDIIDDIPEDFDWYNDDIVFDDIYTWEEEEYTWEDDYAWEEDFYFDEELETIDLDMVDFEEQPIFENFEEFETFEEMPIIEEVFFEEDYTMEPPPMMTEEIFTEEFEEDFTDFLEETGMEEEFTQFLEEEGITAEEFFEEITEEEFNEELTEESFEEFEEEFTESPTIEESPQEVVENEEEEVGSEPEIEEEQELAQNESTTESESNEPETNQEEESSSESSEESDVQTESSEEQEDIQSEDREEMDTEDRIVTDVARVETKLKENLKKIAKQIAQVTKQNTQNLSKEDIFFKQNNSFEEYKNQTFYSARSIYEDVSMGLFLQVDLSPYTGDIYLGTTLNSYIQDDPVEIHRVKLLNIQKTKNKLLAELEALKQ